MPVPAHERRIREREWAAFKDLLRHPTTLKTSWRQANERMKLYYKAADLEGDEHEEMRELVAWHRKRHDSNATISIVVTFLLIAMLILKYVTCGN